MSTEIFLRRYKFRARVRREEIWLNGPLAKVLWERAGGRRRSKSFGLRTAFERLVDHEGQTAADAVNAFQKIAEIGNIQAKRASLNPQKMRLYSLPSYLGIIELSFSLPMFYKVELKFPLNVIM